MSLLFSVFNRRGSFSVAIRITILYMIIGSLWIAFSDRLLLSIFTPDSLGNYAKLQTIKGLIYILLTSVFLFLLVLTNLKRVQQTETKRRYIEGIYRTIFETTVNATVIIENDATISLVNREFEKLSGFSKKEIEGEKKWPEFVAEEDRERMLEYHRRRRIDPLSVPARYDFKFITRNGNTRFIYLTVGMIKDTNQTVASLLDITDKKDLEAKYLRAQRLDSIGTLAGGIAHDLNNILAPVLLSAQALKKSLIDESSRRLLSIVENSAKRGSELTKQILAFVRGFHGDFAIIQPKHILKEIVSITRSTFPKSIAVNTDIEKNLALIKGSAIQIHQALLNICINSRDAMPDGGTLTFSAKNSDTSNIQTDSYPEEREGKYVHISISDTGCGIPEDMLDKLFLPFFTTKPEGKGTGLGLSTVDYIVKRHNGFLTVGTAFGRGTTFNLFFPAVTHEQETATHEITEDDIPIGNNELLLVVDDDAAVNEITAEILKTHGYQVISAINGADGISKYRRYMDKIALILTDHNMPFMGGDEMIRRLTEINPAVKILITSGTDEDVLPLKTDNNNVVGHLQKPYSTYQLLSKLRDVLSEKPV